MNTRLVLEIDDALQKRLAMRASAHGRTLEAEARAILEAEARLLDDDPSLPVGQRIVRAFSGSGVWVDDDFQDRIDRTFRNAPYTPRDPFADEGHGR